MNLLSPAHTRFLNRFLTCPAAVLLALAITGCSSVKSQVDKGAINARTFSFLNTGPRPAPSYADKSPQAHAIVQQAIISSLAKKGVSQVASGGDVTVGYLVIVGNNVTTTSLDSYFGYTDDANALVEKAHKEQTRSKDSRAYFEEGTLVIDFIQPQTSKLLQRRTIQAEVMRNLSTEQRAARVQALVDKELSTVAVAH